MRICGPLLALLLTASPAIADDADDCNQSEDPTLRVQGCTAMVLSGEWTGRDLAEILNNRGIAYKDLGLAQQAIDDYDTALRIDPDFLYLYINRGWAYTDLPQFMLALEDFNHVIDVAPGTPIAYLGRGWAHLWQGMPPELAIEDFDKALALLPGFAYAYYARGIAFQRMEEFARAVDDFDEALALEPGNPTYLYRRALTHCYADDLAAAVADINQRWYFAPATVARDQQMLAEKRFYRRPVSGLVDEATQSALKAWIAGGCW